MVMPVQYPYRRVNHIFGFCQHEIKGVEKYDPDNQMRYTGVGECKNNWDGCPQFVTATMANPFCPELVGKKAEIKHILPQAEQKKRSKKSKQEPLV